MCGISVGADNAAASPVNETASIMAGKKSGAAISQTIDAIITTPNRNLMISNVSSFQMTPGINRGDQSKYSSSIQPNLCRAGTGSQTERVEYAQAQDTSQWGQCLRTAHPAPPHSGGATLQDRNTLLAMPPRSAGPLRAA